MRSTVASVAVGRLEGRRKALTRSRTAACGDDPRRDTLRAGLAIILTSVLLLASVRADGVQGPQEPQDQPVNLDRVRKWKGPHTGVVKMLRERWSAIDKAADLPLRKRMIQQLVEFAGEPATAANALTGVAAFLVERDDAALFTTKLEDATTRAIIGAVAARRFDERDTSILVGFGLVELHRRRSVLAVAVKHLEVVLDQPEAFARTLDLIVEVIDGEAKYEDGAAARNRAQAVDELAAFVERHGRQAIVFPRLERLCFGEVDFRRTAEWRELVARFAKEGLGRTEVLTYALERERDRSNRLREDLIRTTQDLIRRISEGGQPPIDYLEDEEPAVRRSALTSVRSTASSLTPEVRAAALVKIGEILARADRGRGDVFRGLVDATAALASSATPAEKEKIAAALLKDPMPKASGANVDILRALREIGHAGDGVGLRRRYDVANAEGRRATDGWRAVRREVVQTSQLSPVGLDLALQALDDEAADIRGVAAVALRRQLDRLDRAAITRLTEQAAKESDAVAAGFMVGTIGNIAESKPGRLSAADYERVLSVDASSPEQVRVGVVRVLGLALDADLAEGVREKIRLRLEAALNGGSTKAIRVATVETLVGRAHPSVGGLLRTWAETNSEAGAPWPAVRDYFIQRAKERAGDLLAMADVLATKEPRATWLPEAVACAAAVLDAEAVDAKSDRQRRLVDWRLESPDSKEWEKVARWTDEVLAEDPAHPIGLLRRGRLYLRRGKRKEAARDLSAAVTGAGAGDLDKNERLVAARDAAREWVYLGDPKAAATALGVVERIGEPAPADIVRRAQIRLLAGEKESAALEPLAKFDAKIIGVTRALAAVISTAPSRREQAAKLIVGVPDFDVETAKRLRTVIDEEKKIAARVRALDADEKSDIATAHADLERQRVSAAIHLVGAIDKKLGERQLERRLLVLRALFPKDEMIGAWADEAEKNGRDGNGSNGNETRHGIRRGDLRKALGPWLEKKAAAEATSVLKA